MICTKSRGSVSNSFRSRQAKLPCWKIAGGGHSRRGWKNWNEFGVRRQSEAATALWMRSALKTNHDRKRRRRFALPAHSKVKYMSTSKSDLYTRAGITD